MIDPFGERVRLTHAEAGRVGFLVPAERFLLLCPVAIES